MTRFRLRWDVLLWGSLYLVSVAVLIALLDGLRVRTVRSYSESPSLARDWDMWQANRAQEGDVSRTRDSDRSARRAAPVPPPATIWFGAGFARLVSIAIGLWTIIFLMFVFAAKGIMVHHDRDEIDSPAKS